MKVFDVRVQIWVNTWYLMLLLLSGRSPPLEISLLGDSLFCVFPAIPEEAKAIDQTKLRWNSDSTHSTSLSPGYK